MSPPSGYKYSRTHIIRSANRFFAIPTWLDEWPNLSNYASTSCLSQTQWMSEWVSEWVSASIKTYDTGGYFVGRWNDKVDGLFRRMKHRSNAWIRRDPMPRSEHPRHNVQPATPRHRQLAQHGPIYGQNQSSLIIRSRHDFCRILIYKPTNLYIPHRTNIAWKCVWPTNPILHCGLMLYVVIYIYIYIYISYNPDSVGEWVFVSFLVCFAVKLLTDFCL